MRKLLSILVLCGLLISVSVAQERNSTYGQVTTPKGDFHVLIIMVSFFEDSVAGSQKVWPYDQLPTFARGENNALFNANPEDIGSQENLSLWYDQMSMGKFRFTADVFPEPIVVKKYANSAGVPITKLINRDVFKQLAERKDIDWSKYDNRKNNPGWKSDNSTSSPDGIIDYVILMYRGPSGGGRAGIEGGPFKLFYEGQEYQVRDGFTSVKTGFKQKDFLVMFTHEFGHNLWSAVHIGGANGVTGLYFHGTYAWGMACPDRRLFMIANAWERWYLGWTEIKYDLKEESDEGVYWLDDFVTTGDAIRVKIPHTEAQYVWLENHQKLTPFDGSSFDKDAFGKPFVYPRKGLVAYVENISSSRSNIHSFNKNANGIRPIDPSGYYDYSFVRNEEKVKKWWGQKRFDFSTIQPNPISGQCSISLLRGDFNNDGLVGYSINSNHPRGKNEFQAMFYLNGEAYDGAFGEGFYWRPLQKIGLGYNPMVRPMLKYDHERKVEPINLNNLSIQLLGYENGRAKVKISYKDPLMTSDQTWAGERIILPYGPDSLKIELDQGVVLRIKQGYTPWYTGAQQELNGSHVFMGKSSLTFQKGTSLILQPHSRLSVEDQSVLSFEEGSEIVIKKGASLMIGDSSELVLSKGVRIRTEHKSSLIILKGYTKRKGLEIKELIQGPGKVMLCNRNCPSQ